MQPDWEIRYHPIDLSRHGLNPFGRPIWRVVWADSRKSKVRWRGKLVTLPRYQHGIEASAKGHWILERWMPPEQVIGMSREQYLRFAASIANPAVEAYPTKGEYELSTIFDHDSGPFSKHIDEVALHHQLQFHGWSHQKQTPAEREISAAAAEEKKEALKDEKFDQIYEEAREETLKCQQ